jgi:iron only hydrogenase large subunit-like protein
MEFFDREAAFPVYTLNNECHDCYKCVRECYVKAIKINDGHASVVNRKCLSCGHCVRVCPSNAKRIRCDVDSVKRLINEQKNVVVSLAPSWAGVFELSDAGMVAVLKRLGFTGVSETALGAQEVSLATASILRNGENALYISSACPVIVDYVRMYHPTFVDALVPIASPALTHAKMLKELYGYDICVVFIGPCASKKTEAYKHPELIDFALTFDELYSWINEAQIKFGDIEFSITDDDKFIPENSYEGALYPVTGGMIETLQHIGITDDVNMMTICSIERFDKAIKRFNLQKINRKIFIEALACDDGCVNGPGIYTKRSGINITADILERIFKREKTPQAAKIIVDEVYRADPVEVINISLEELIQAMQKIGKYKEEDELNCGGCGYQTCRDLAAALLAGEAEPSMCVSYMRKVAMKKVDAMLRCMPSASVIADGDLNVLEANDAFIDMFCGDSHEYCASRPDALKGMMLDRVIGFPDTVMSALRSGKDIRMEQFPINGRLFDISAFTIEPNAVVGAIITEVAQSKTNRYTIARTVL